MQKMLSNGSNQTMKIKFTKAFKTQYKKAPKDIQTKFFKNLDLFFADEFMPILNNHTLKGKWKECRSINITGNWRVIYTINENVYLFIAFGTHSQLYS